MLLVREEINLVLSHLVCGIFMLVPPKGTGSYFFLLLFVSRVFRARPAWPKENGNDCYACAQFPYRNPRKKCFSKNWLLRFLECSVFSLWVWEGRGYSDCDFQQCLYEAWITIDTATNDQFLKTFWQALFLFSTSWVDQVLHFDTR